MDTIVSMAFAILNGPRQYVAIINTLHKRIQCRLRDDKGIIAPSPGVTRFIDETDPKIITRALTAASNRTEELFKNGGFYKTSMTFEMAMKKYLKWHEETRNENKKLLGHAKRSLETFGCKRLSDITRKDIRNWINKELAPKYSHNTVKNAVAVPKALYNWLIKEEIWYGSNPFAQHEWRAQGNEIKVKPIISVEEWQLIRSLCHDSYIEQAVTIAYYTGLRPTEVYRVMQQDFNHDELVLNVRVQKTKGRPYTRFIAIPIRLSIWALNHDWREIKESTVQTKIQTLRAKHPTLTNLCMESFRDNLSNTMDALGVNHEFIDAHQGRYQNTVLKKHYLRDPYRAVKLMRPYIHEAFDEGEELLRRVK